MKEKTKDYNGIVLPTEVKASKIVISVSQKYIGKYGTEEDFQLDEITMSDYHSSSLEDILNAYGITLEYGEIYLLEDDD
jgi:hypothetical protein